MEKTNSEQVNDGVSNTFACQKVRNTRDEMFLDVGALPKLKRSCANRVTAQAGML